MPKPMLGILTSTLAGGPPPAPRWPQRRTFQEIIGHGRDLGVMVIVFSPWDVDWRRRRTRGWSLRATGEGLRWFRAWFRLPDVVYNRVPSRVAEGAPAVRRCLRRLQERLGGRVFNPFYLNKWMVYHRLAQDPELWENLPETVPLRSLRDLLHMLREHGRVYLKPVGGSLGNWTIAIVRRPAGSYRLYYNPMGKRTRSMTLPDWSSLCGALDPMVSRRAYVAQKGIALARVRRRRFDIRTLVQKDASGRWQLTGAAARVAGPGQITTHVPRGGSRASLERVITSAFGSEAMEGVWERLERLSVRAAEGLESSLQRNFGELSLDVGMDQSGHLWLFEINAKPLRFDETPIRRRAQRTMLEYARALALGSVAPAWSRPAGGGAARSSRSA